MLLQVEASAAEMSRGPSLMERPNLRVAFLLQACLHEVACQREVCSKVVAACFAPFESLAGVGSIQPRRDAALLQAG